MNCTAFLGSYEEPLSGRNWPPGDAIFISQFSGFLHKPPGGDEHLPGNVSKISSTFGVLGFLG